jgi:hypothetical protein
LFLIPNTLGQSVFLALIAASGMLFEQHLITPTTDVEKYRQVGILMIALIYLPATLLTLRRPNEGNLPLWITGPYDRLVRRR